MTGSYPHKSKIFTSLQKKNTFEHIYCIYCTYVQTVYLVGCTSAAQEYLSERIQYTTPFPHGTANTNLSS